MKSKELNKFAKLKFGSHSIEVDRLMLNVLENIDYFRVQKSAEASELSKGLLQLNYHLEQLSKISSTLEKAAHDCDFDENSPGNGYWSHIHSFNCAIRVVTKTCKQLTKNREKILFNRKFYIK
jgi:hypothetical protein